LSVRTLLAVTGDINGDQLADFAVGAYPAQRGAGSVNLYYGALGDAAAISAVPALTLSGTNPPSGGYGFAVASIVPRPRRRSTRASWCALERLEEGQWMR
jgi:hypothetical protein